MRLLLSLLFVGILLCSTIAFAEEVFTLSGEVMFPKSKGEIYVWLKTQEELKKGEEPASLARSFMIKPSPQQQQLYNPAYPRSQNAMQFGLGNIRHAPGTTAATDYAKRTPSPGRTTTNLANLLGSREKGYYTSPQGHLMYVGGGEWDPVREQYTNELGWILTPEQATRLGQRLGVGGGRIVAPTGKIEQLWPVPGYNIPYP